MMTLKSTAKWFVVLCFCCLWAGNAEAGIQVDGLYYDLDFSSKTATVTYLSGLSPEKQDDYVSGALAVPSIITYGGCNYLVIGVGAMAFRDCKHLTTLSLGKTILNIDWSAFSYCTGLTTLFLPKSLEYIADDAFEHCMSLSTICIKTPTPPKVSNPNIFKYAPAMTLYVPKGARDAYRSAVGWKKFAKIIEGVPPIPDLNNRPNPADIKTTDAIKDGFYYIQNAYPEFYGRQQVFKAMYACLGDSNLYWGSLNKHLANFIFYIKKEADGNYSVKNQATGTYMGARPDSTRDDCCVIPMTTMLVTEQRFVPLGDDQYNVVGNCSTYACHTLSHLNGYGDCGLVIAWNGLKESPSAWYLIPADDYAAKSLRY